jgi:hypothetical protein
VACFEGIRSGYRFTPTLTFTRRPSGLNPHSSSAEPTDAGFPVATRALRLDFFTIWVPLVCAQLGRGSRSGKGSTLISTAIDRPSCGVRGRQVPPSAPPLLSLLAIPTTALRQF